MKKTIVLGITGSIAASKAVELVHLFKTKGHDVFVIMTPSAAQMVRPTAFEKATGHAVIVDLFPKDFDTKNIMAKKEVDHIFIATQADIFVIAPATANTIAKVALGIADNFLTSSLLATRAPVVICPAMNTNMWEHEATQKNITTLHSWGYQIIEPTVGMLACGYEGKGKLENVQEIANEVERVLANTTRLKGKKILVTAGATKERIDDVRYITNPSSGKMGLAIAEEAYKQGAEVFLVRAENAVASAYPITQATFSTPDELSALIQKHLKGYQYLFHTAAVGDFTIKNAYNGKVSSREKHILHLEPQMKIIEHIKHDLPNIHLVGFKAEYALKKNELIKKAYQKLQKTQADMIIANDIAKKNSGFGSDNNAAIAVFPNGTTVEIPYASKRIVARKILDLIFS